MGLKIGRIEQKLMEKELLHFKIIQDKIEERHKEEERKAK
jgi:hypothetical protein